MKKKMKAKTKLQIEIMREFFVRSKTNNKEFAKQYFTVTKSNIYEPALLIRKLVLSDDNKLYKDITLLKTFKGKGLYEMRFSLKISTLKQVMHILNEGVSLTEYSEQFKRDVLTDFLDFLLKNGYCDTDVYAEPPTAIDQYLIFDKKVKNVKNTGRASKKEQRNY